MKNIALVVLCSFSFLSPIARADSSDGKSAAPTFHVQPLDADFPAGELAGPGITVHPMPGNSAPNPDDSGFVLPSPDQIKVILEAAGLSDETKDFDTLDQDQLMIRAKRSTLESLEKHYPTFAQRKLRKLSELLQHETHELSTSSKEDHK